MMTVCGCRRGDVLVEERAIAAAQDAGNVDPRLGDRAELRQQFGDLRGLKALVERRGERRQIALSATWESRSCPPTGRRRTASCCRSGCGCPRSSSRSRAERPLLARLAELLDHVGLVRAVGHRVVGMLARPQAMAGDVLGGQHDVLHARVAGHRDPLVDVQPIGGVGRGGGLAVGKLVSDERAHAEVDEHAVLERFPLPQLLQRQPLAARRRGVSAPPIAVAGQTP